jgi:hypothetical protein
MKFIRQGLVAASGLAILVFVLGVINAAPTNAAATPIVKVVNTPAEPVPVVGAVRVHNNSNNPLTVDIANPVGAQCFQNFVDGNADCVIATVPEGQILTVEEITCGVSVLHDTRIGSLLLVMASPAVPPATGLVNLNHTLVLTREFSVLDGSPQHDYYGVTAQVRMYAVGGAIGNGSTTLFVSAQSGDTGSIGQVSCAVSGHMSPQ